MKLKQLFNGQFRLIFVFFASLIALKICLNGSPFCGEVKYAFVELINSSKELIILQDINNILKDSMRISQALWYMGNTASNDSELYLQMKDMSVQLEARLNLLYSNTSSLERLQLSMLSQKLQNELIALQNPKECKKAKFIVTNLPDCGFGCQVHHAALCLHLAFAKNRTLFIDGYKWYGIFEPITSCYSCGPNKIFVRRQNEIDYDAPPALRKDLAEALAHLHESPYAWFRGNLLRYIMRLRPSQFKEKLIKDLSGIKSKRPIVGVHVRRTDKNIREAAAVPLPKYMEQVKRIFQILTVEAEILQTSFDRRVYLASDEKKVFEEAQRQFSEYNYTGEYRDGSGLRARRSQNGLKSIVYDVFHLANCDYVVCTFSSNICRLVFELILTDSSRYGDRTRHVITVDEMYTIHGSQNRGWSVIGSTTDGKFKKGERLRVKDLLLNGYINSTAGQKVPAYMIKEDIMVLP